jgi:hypothetical protein
LSVLSNECRWLSFSPAALDTQHLCLSTQHLLHFLMRRVLSAELAELVSFQPIRIVFLVLHGRVIPLFAERTSHVDDFAHFQLRNSSSAIRLSQIQTRSALDRRLTRDD